MNEQILSILSSYGADVIMLALLINFITGIVKIPIKSYADKKGASVGKYLTLIPILLGFGFAFLYQFLACGWENITAEAVFSKGVSCASLSLALYAVFEKFFPKNSRREDPGGSENAKLSENEGKVQEIEKATDASIADVTQPNDTSTKEEKQDSDSTEEQAKKVLKKIILRGISNEQAGTEK